MDQAKYNDFQQYIDNNYIVYNSLFSRLPYEKMENIGSLLPFLTQLSTEGLHQGKTPVEIINEFFEKYAHINDDKLKQDLLFTMIQFIERQVVLFDSIEDSSFDKLHNMHGIGSISNLNQMAKQQDKVKEVHTKLKTFKVRVVFTAHPTQFYPNTVLRIIYDLEKAIKTNDIREIDLLLKQLGKTPFINKIKPTPLDEARSIIYYLRTVYYDAIGTIHQKIKDKFFNNSEDVPVLELGFWPGGDRDGNPFVTAEITMEVAKELRYSILKNYYNQLKQIRRRLSFKGIGQPLKELSDRIYVNMFGLKNDLTYEELLNALEKIREDLIKYHSGLMHELLDDLVLKVKSFGLYFASLDIRQDSSIHGQLFEEIVQRETQGKKTYSGMSKEEKLAFLSNPNIRVFHDDFKDEVLKDTVKNISQLKHIQELNGEKACHRYIISNSTTIFSVLEILALFKFCGYQDKEINFDIIPLFETLEGMENAQGVMNELYSNPIYKNHLAHRKNKQTVMLGFSDGTKDGGYVKANWEIFKTKEILTQEATNNKVDIIFFDGRGGPPARGGGKTHQYYESQGKTISDEQIQLTIQGQTITSMYGSIPQAIFNFEQLITAGVSNSVFNNPESHLSEVDKTLINKISNIALEKYMALKNHKSFVPYLETRSTLPYYTKTNIGSRPGKRGSGKQLEFKDLRAIPFVGAWSQLKQNVPGYYGFGTALKTLMEEGKTHELKALFIHSLYFRTLVQNSMMALTKSFFPLTQYMKKDKGFKDFWEDLYNEYKLSVQTMLEISGQKELMENETLSKLSVEYREKIVLPLLVIQQYALIKIEESKTEKEKMTYEKMVIRSLFGNINASRNSA